MKSKILLVASLLVSQFVLAQKFSIKGHVTDTLSSPMPGATVMLMNPKDSSLVSFGVTDSKGNFELKNITKADYEVKVTFMSYLPFAKRLSPADFTTPIVELGALKMQSASTQLHEMIIKGDKAPVTFKRDTIEYNASSFKIKANGTVEDLLKKMPGMEVQTDGSIKAQGETVQRVMVDGREFFGRDPKLATRNLPADAVEKVQVYDKKSDQSVFTGIDDGQREKTINLALKESKRNGAFGNITAGGGSEDRWLGKANINRFGKGKQLSFLGMGNNINEQGFSMDDYMNFSGGSQQMVGGGSIRVQLGGDNQSGVPLNFGGRQNGITTNYAGGVNYNRDISNKTKLTSSYFYNRLDQNLNQKLHRINYLSGDSTYNFDQESQQFSVSDNHRVNLVLDHQIDSVNSIKFSNALTYTTQDQNLHAKGTSTLSNQSLYNESERHTSSKGDNYNLSSSLLYRHRFHKKGRTISSNFTLGLSGTTADGTNESDNFFYDGKTPNTAINQITNQNNSSQAYSTTIAYTEPLGNRKYLELDYSFRNNLNEVNKEVYDEKNGASTMNLNLSNKYNSAYLYNRPGFNFRINRTKYNFALGASYQMTTLKGDLTLRNVKINRSFKNLLPVARLNYDFTSSKHLRLEYETSMQEPSITQLQPVVDNTDQINQSVGNPELKPSYTHRISTNYTQFDPGRFIGFFGFINAIYLNNAIGTLQTYQSNLSRITQPVNVDYNFTLNGNFNVSFPIKKLSSRFNFGPTTSFVRGISLIQRNDVLSRITSQQYTSGGTVRYDYTLKEILTAGLSANISKQQTLYSSSQQNQRFLNETYSVDININFLKSFSYNFSFDYYRYTSQTTDFSQTIPMLNMSMSWFMLKAKSGELKAGVNNLLNRSMSISQTANTTYLQQVTSNNLGRYFMVSFTYALNKQLNPMGGGNRRGGGGPRIMIRQ